MKRKALLIGNTHGLQGVPLDLNGMAAFLRSSTGGAWYSHEIQFEINPRRNALLETLASLRRASLDYAVVLFTGHGAFNRQTVLELNGDEESVIESDLLNLASRQLTIFDCCRAISEERVQKSLSMEAFASLNESIEITRLRYETRIMQAIPQQVRLYGCSVGQCSYDTADGALYLNNLLMAARQIDGQSPYKTVGDAHEEARIKTAAAAKHKDGGPQEPDASLPKCITSQQLIISLK